MTLKSVLPAADLVEIVGAIGKVSHEGILRYTPDRIKIEATDDEETTVVSVTLDARGFDFYEAGNGENGVSLIKLIDALKEAPKESRAKFEVLEGGGLITIRYRGSTYRLTMPEEVHTINVPEQTWTAEIVVDGADFKSMIKSCNPMAAEVKLGVRGETFYAEAETEDGDSVNVEIPEKYLISFKTGGDVEAIYDCDLIADLVKGVGKGTEIRLGLGTDKPLKLSYNIVKGNGTISYIIAQYSEEDEACDEEEEGEGEGEDECECECAPLDDTRTRAPASEPQGEPGPENNVS